jgi:hypothetical protein
VQSDKLQINGRDQANSRPDYRRIQNSLWRNIGFREDQFGGGRCMCQWVRLENRMAVLYVENGALKYCGRAED